MSLSVLAHEHDVFGLYRGDEQVGWIDGRAVALTGFENSKEAELAAQAAFDAVRRWLARERRLDLVTGPAKSLRPKRERSRTKLMLDGVPIGRILEPGESKLDGAGYGFEIMLPPGMNAVNGISAAKIMDTALARREEARRLELAPW
jgi:hypothetical protein